MRFRLATDNPNQGGQRLGDGIGSFLKAAAMAPMYQAQAAEEAAMQGQKRDLMGAQINQSNAHAALFNTQAAGENLQQQRGTPGELIRTAALMNGVAPSQTEDFTRYAQTGKMPQRFQPPPVDGVGPYEPAPSFYNDGTAAKIFKQLGLTTQALTVGDKSVSSIAKASGDYRDQGLGDQVLSGGMDAGRVAEAQAAVDGKARFNNIGNSGRGFNLFTGAEQELSPGMSILFDKGANADIGRTNAQTGASVAQAGASRASAANAYASARLHGAQTDKVRQDIQQGSNGGSGQVQIVPSADGSVMLVNKVTGEARPVAGPGGVPLMGKSAAAGQGAKMTEAQAKANIFGQRMSEANKVFDGLAAKGVNRPGIIKEGVQGAVGMIPFIGDTMAVGAGNIMNSMPGFLGGPSDEQQMSEQAQRDFINAVLRRESGAVINPEEFANAAQQYFVQPGDSESVKRQKRTNRQNATQLMLMEVPQTVQDRFVPAGQQSPILDGPSPPPMRSNTGGATGGWGADAGIARVSGDADFNALPSGSVFIGPDGQQRRKP